MPQPRQNSAASNTKPGAPSCVPQQGGRFCSRLEPPTRAALKIQVVPKNSPPPKPPIQRPTPFALPRLTPSSRGAQRRRISLRFLFLPPTKIQDRVPHPALLSRVGGFVAARASNSRSAINSRLLRRNSPPPKPPDPASNTSRPCPDLRRHPEERSDEGSLLDFTSCHQQKYETGCPILRSSAGREVL